MFIYHFCELFETIIFWNIHIYWLYSCWYAKFQNSVFLSMWNCYTLWSISTHCLPSHVIINLLTSYFLLLWFHSLKQVGLWSTYRSNYVFFSFNSFFQDVLCHFKLWDSFLLKAEFHCVYILYFLYTFNCWWEPGLFSILPIVKNRNTNIALAYRSNFLSTYILKL